MPAVSVIVPVYNVEPFVARCVRSLFSQTLEDLEFIFIDDCTPDRSMEVIREVLEREFPAREPQVRFFQMPENSGQAGSAPHDPRLTWSASRRYPGDRRCG